MEKIKYLNLLSKKKKSSVIFIIFWNVNKTIINWFDSLKSVEKISNH